jgi:2-dehydropantoate 2-reductase
MRTLIVGAGATGGYLGAGLLAGGRDVTFLVHAPTQTRLGTDGLRVHGHDGRRTATQVRAVTRAALDGPYDVVLLAVRSSVVEAAIADFSAAVGAATRILPVVNGMAHLHTLTAAFGTERVLGGTARLATSLRADGGIDEVQPGAALQIGSLEGRRDAVVAAVGDEFSVSGITVTIVENVEAAMWNKFVFITATAVLTCLLGDVIGPIADTSGGGDVAEQVLAEVATVAAAERYPLTTETRTALHTILTDPFSRFAPSMYRDLHAGRPVEGTVLRDLADRARRHLLSTPLLDAALVVLELQSALRTSVF